MLRLGGSAGYSELLMEATSKLGRAVDGFMATLSLITAALVVPVITK